MVGWIQAPVEDVESNQVEHQLVALTYTGGWYRLGLPKKLSSAAVVPTSPIGASPLSASPPSVKSKKHNPRSYSGSSFSKNDKGKEREGSDKDGKESRDCKLEEYRKFGRWDGW